MKNITLIRLTGLTLTCVALMACNWVKPTPQSHKVALATAKDVTACVRKGTTTSTTLAKVAIVPRSAEKMFDEWVTMAKNEAVILGGDTIVPEAKPTPASHIFGVYLCR